MEFKKAKDNGKVNLKYSNYILKYVVVSANIVVPRGEYFRFREY